MARGRKSSLGIVLSPEERTSLQRWQRSTMIAAGLARRGRIILRKRSRGYCEKFLLGCCKVAYNAGS
jgi:hypothetical protein